MRARARKKANKPEQRRSVPEVPDRSASTHGPSDSLLEREVSTGRSGGFTYLDGLCECLGRLMAEGTNLKQTNIQPRQSADTQVKKFVAMVIAARCDASFRVDSAPKKWLTG